LLLLLLLLVVLYRFPYPKRVLVLRGLIMFLPFLCRMVGNFQEIDHGIDSPLAGLGYGLPISRSYCRYFGVSMQHERE
jgi:hypothetical protein